MQHDKCESKKTMKSRRKEDKIIDGMYENFVFKIYYMKLTNE